ncbi:MBOAT-domain-containing protein [Sparassis latifolia]
MDIVFLPLATSLGVSIDQVKLIFCLLVSYPLGSVFIRIPTSKPTMKHLFNIAISLFYFLPVLNLWSGTLQLLVSVLGTYFLAAKIKRGRMPWIVFAFVMGHLTANHVIRTFRNQSYETFEITGPQMVLTMKLTTFAWNVWDSRRPVEELDQWQREKRVLQYPSLVEFLGYSLYFPSVLVGPYLEYADYVALIDGTIYKKPVVDKNRRLVPHGRKRVAYRKMVIGLALLGIYVTGISTFSYSATAQEWFKTKSFLYRFLFFQISGLFERTKYYAVWTLTEGAAILTGFGFSGYTSSGGTRWEGAANVNVWFIEFAPNMKVLLDNWNMKANIWLRECVYKRVTPKGKKPGFRSSMITFATSAFWHGISGGYYLTFVTGGFMQTAGRLCRAYLRPLFLPPTYVASRTAPPPPQTPLKRLYDLAGIVCTTLMLNYAGAPFMLLTMHDSLAGWSALQWYGHWMIGGALLFFYSGGRRLLKEAQVARVKKAGLYVEKNIADRTRDDSKAVPILPPVGDAVREMETEFERLMDDVMSPKEDI